jgi:hypothetical protein
VKHFSGIILLCGVRLLGRLLALPTNIRLGFKGLASTEHSSLLKISVNYVRKKFYNVGLSVNFD